MAEFGIRSCSRFTRTKASAPRSLLRSPSLNDGITKMATATTTMNPETADVFAKYVVPNYTRFPVSLVRGEGSLVWDDQGRQYLDFFSGWGCNLLGHCPPRVVEAIQNQAAELHNIT